MQLAIKTEPDVAAERSLDRPQLSFPKIPFPRGDDKRRSRCREWVKAEGGGPSTSRGRGRD